MKSTPKEPATRQLNIGMTALSNMPGDHNNQEFQEQLQLEYYQDLKLIQHLKYGTDSRSETALGARASSKISRVNISHSHVQQHQPC
ncbi:hypothetical protein RclHR1_04140009 [Rhizophagus clarus]|uniref:Uncharacterized protein n=1 Tax=Rhizophagus clarus TaxID=94130 RepID=A0A2Z6RGW9_9GLOM|nr:hypothetical protein RclHR1_04140009 [Rhizophagus clarus]GES80825.1 hypothetical protein RCL_jg17670.t1 [Rhizophagus clarus]